MSDADRPAPQSGRQKVYQFLQLPHHVQEERGRELGLARSDDPSDQVERFTLWIHRAKEKGVVDRLLTGVAGKASRKWPHDSGDCPDCKHSLYEYHDENGLCHWRQHGAVRACKCINPYKGEAPTPV